MSRKDMYNLPNVTQISVNGYGSRAVVNRTDFNISLEVDNTLHFIVFGTDRRREKIKNTYTLMVVDDIKDEILLVKDLEVIDADRGHLVANLLSGDLHKFCKGYYRYSIIDSNNHLLVTDERGGYNGWMEVVGSPYPYAKKPQKLRNVDFMDTQFGTPLKKWKVSNRLVGSGAIGNYNRKQTIRFTSGESKGNVIVQASLSNLNPELRDWFDVHEMALTKDDELITLEGSYMWVRFLLSDFDDIDDLVISLSLS